MLKITDDYPMFTDLKTFIFSYYNNIDKYQALFEIQRLLDTNLEPLSLKKITRRTWIRFQLNTYLKENYESIRLYSSPPRGAGVKI